MSDKDTNIKEKLKQALESTIRVISDDLKTKQDKKNINSNKFDHFEFEKLDNKINFNFNSEKSINFKFDFEQISRVCFNLIKNSVESLKEKAQKTANFIKNIDIEIKDQIDYISLTIIDTGLGFKNINTSELTKPYFTTKADGTGLGLSIVSKIINDHNGVITFTNLIEGAKVEIKFFK